MYDSSWDDQYGLPDPERGYDPALAHRGDYHRVVDRHLKDVARAYSTGGIEGLRALGPFLLKRIADARTMFRAAQHLRRGHKAPGPNGLRLEELSNSETWSLCRALARSIRDGSYRPGPSRRIQIPKPGKSGFRTITLQPEEDRVVGRALMLILQPMFERLFSPFSFGFRPRIGRQEALATALTLASRERRWCWVSDDIASAFDHIPLGRLLTACGQVVPPEVVEFIRVIADTGTKHGVRQGSSASPMLGNVYFHYSIDRPWQRDATNPPLIRYADDLLVPCVDSAEAAVVYARLADQARDAGTPVKGSEDSSIFNLVDGQPIVWLGFRIAREGEHVGIGIADKAWDALGLRFAKAHLAPNATLRARAIIQGWLRQMGPCYPCESRPAVLERVREIAAAWAFDETPTARELRVDWQLAYARWQRLFLDQAKKLPHRLLLV